MPQTMNFPYSFVSDDTTATTPTPQPVTPPTQPEFTEPEIVVPPMQAEAPAQVPATIPQELTPVATQSAPVQSVPADGNKPPVDASRIIFWIETQRIISEVEKKLGMRIITLFIPMADSLASSDVQNFYYHLEKMGKQEKIGVILFGPGGSGIAAYRLIKLIRNYTKTIIGLVPDTAASAMTMFSLGTDMLMTGPLTTFSAIDSSLANHPLAPLDSAGYPVSVEITQIGKFLEMVKADTYDSTDFSKGAFKALTDKVHPLLLGAIQRAFSLSKRLTASILKTHIDGDDKINAIVNTLNDEYPTHGYPVLPEDLAQLGIQTTPMSSDLNRLCTDLLDLYRKYSDGGSKMDGNKKISWRCGSILESAGFRTWYYSENVYMLNDKNEWKRSSGFGEYKHAGEILTKQGFIKIDLYNTKQFKDWMDGKKITEATD